MNGQFNDSFQGALVDAAQDPFYQIHQLQAHRLGEAALPYEQFRAALVKTDSTDLNLLVLPPADRKLKSRMAIQPEEVKTQPEGWKQISEERTSQLEWIAPKIIKRVFIRPRYVKAETFAIAPLPPQPIAQGMVGPGFLAEILVNKYEYHQPLFRQEKKFRQQFGVELSRKTMGDWVKQAAELLKPVYRVIREDLQKGSYLQADETPIRYLDQRTKSKRLALGL